MVDERVLDSCGLPETCDHLMVPYPGPDRLGLKFSGGEGTYMWIEVRLLVVVWGLGDISH